LIRNLYVGRNRDSFFGVSQIQQEGMFAIPVPLQFPIDSSCRLAHFFTLLRKVEV
jgi:hypothetical protein